MIAHIKKILEDKESLPDTFKRNYVKEYLQVVILSFIYTHAHYKNLMFYGGSCLRHCYDLPRLSEDLDFIDKENEVDIQKLCADLQDFFSHKYNITVDTKVQKFRITLKFPILFQLNLTHAGETNLLYLKIEVYKEMVQCKKYSIAIIPVFKFGESFLIRTFDLPTLMATKINAILFRKWEKTDAKGNMLARVKGRDYFDLMWYLQKKIEPNLTCIEGVNSQKQLKEMLRTIVSTVDSRSIHYDLEALIENRSYVQDIADHLKSILLSMLIKDKRS